METSHLMKLSMEELGKTLPDNPRFQKAVAWLKMQNLNALAPGKYEIDGTNSWASVADALLKPLADEMTYEVHAKYIDIQSPISGPETYGICETPAGIPPVDPKKDCVLFPAKGTAVTLIPGEFAVFFPTTGAHAPQHAMDGATSVRKIVVKIRA